MHHVIKNDHGLYWNGADFSTRQCFALKLDDTIAHTLRTVAPGLLVALFGAGSRLVRLRPRDFVAAAGDARRI